MQDMTIFYSWQSDTPNKHNRWFILDCIKKAVVELKRSGEITESPRVEHDTTGIGGTVSITETIYERIADSSIFVADVTFVGSTRRSVLQVASECLSSLEHRRFKEFLSRLPFSVRPKKIPNPNVLLETGFAARCLGWKRVVSVMNTSFGSPDKQIFDLKHHKFPATYSLSAVVGTTQARADLVQGLKERIAWASAEFHAEALRVRGRLDVNCLKVIELYRKSPSFAEPPRELEDAVRRLLDLRVIYADINRDAKMYGYHWTQLGKLMLESV
jgi:hypothetical protein